MVCASLASSCGCCDTLVNQQHVLATGLFGVARRYHRGSCDTHEHLDDRWCVPVCACVACLRWELLRRLYLRRVCAAAGCRELFTNRGPALEEFYPLYSTAGVIRGVFAVNVSSAALV